MTTLRQSAVSYIPPETKNISDLKQVSTEIDVQHKIVNKGTPEEFSYNYVVIEGIEYRVPNSVLKSLKIQLEEKPESTLFKVKKVGEGLKTEYFVFMLD